MPFNPVTSGVVSASWTVTPSGVTMTLSNNATNGIDRVRITNIGTVTAWVIAGHAGGTYPDTTIAAADTNGIMPIPAGGVLELALPTDNEEYVIAASTISGTTDTYLWMNFGNGLAPSFTEPLAIAEQYGVLTWAIDSVGSAPFVAGSLMPAAFNSSADPAASGATVKGYWTQSAPTSEPTADGTTVIDVTTLSGTTGPDLYWGGINSYVGFPTTPGTWYLSYWLDSDGSDNGGFVLSPMDITS